MKRIFLLVVFSTFSFLAFSQNYNCFNTNEVTFFINGTNFLRGMRIDSVRTSGTDTIYYPYHTCRVNDYLRFYPYAGVDTFHMNRQGGSWLGGRVVKHSDGIFDFDNNFGFHTTIKTQANLGDTFSFYHDTTQISFWAQVTNIDTQTILGSVDSVKTFVIHSDSAGVSFTEDWLNGFSFKISKSRGFIKVFDLYMFPYRRLDSIRQVRFFDYYLDHLLNNVGVGDMGFYRNNYPDTNNSIFNIVRFRNITQKQLYQRNAGDALGTLTSVETMSSYQSKYTLDSVTSIDFISSDSISYFTFDTSMNLFKLYLWSPFDTSYSHLFSRGIGSNRFWAFDTSKLPEEVNSNYFYYYYPNDTADTTSPCYYNALYTIEYNTFNDDTGGLNIVSSWIGYGIAPYIITETYMPGVGKIAYVRNPHDTYTPSEDMGLTYLSKGGCVCRGARAAALKTFESANPVDFTFDVIPNPVYDEFKIKFQDHSVKTISISDYIGRVVYSNSCEGEIKIDSKKWPQGEYIINVYDVYGNRVVKEVLVVH